MIAKGPMSDSFVAEGRDDPRAGISVTFTHWGNLWLWDVIYWSEKDGGKHLTNDNGHIEIDDCDW
jgi:hypothetical protein